MAVSSTTSSASNPYSAVSPQAPRGTTTKPKFDASTTLGDDDNSGSDDSGDSTAFSDTSTKPKNNSSSSSSSGSQLNITA